MTKYGWHELYFHWLREKVGVTTNQNPRRRHWLLLEQLINTRFEWSVPNDDNRAEDGKDLRAAFITEYSADPEMLEDNCSMLEMLVALCQRLVFEAEGDVDEWFWELMENVDLRQFTDEVYEDNDDDVFNHVDYILRRIIDRTYDHTGRGGLFPLQNPTVDQTKVEIWYQMSAYLLEREE